MDPALLALNGWSETQLLEHFDALLQAFRACRAHTLQLCQPLSAEDMLLQSMPDASPTKWHLAHTSWFFETFLLAPFEPDFAWFDEAFQVLFNSYYNGIGEQFPRPRRGLISRPDLARVLTYRDQVEQRLLRLAGAADSATRAQLAPLLRLGINHEQQHQELLLTDIQHALAQNPGAPVYHAQHALPAAMPALHWQPVRAGTAEIGHAGDGFCFDNETPRQQVLLAPFQIASRPVSNREWQAFIAAGGYEDPLLWLSEGWAWRQAEQIQAPLYWATPPAEAGPDAGAKDQRQFSLRGLQLLHADAAVTHISYYEADAYARWAGARLPTEAEWETAVRQQHVPARSIGQGWEWTGSAYLPYSGFQAAAGTVGEYNGKFMINQMVLRGHSPLTPPGHTRCTYRNFFPPATRWQATTLRLARDGQVR
ncbi:MAG: ergothioneine biosynthesis protein EgtB [Xanthomonadales bacterium]|nr:ergothioneine biosynthesis protein EgtB [Xanthomonadales bacterium]